MLAWLRASRDHEEKITVEHYRNFLKNVVSQDDTPLIHTSRYFSNMSMRMKWNISHGILSSLNYCGLF